VLAAYGADHGEYHGSAEEHYGRAISLREAQREEAGILIAYAMNGAPLPPEHGAPFRLIVPGWYGMASVKWLKRLTVLSSEFEGLFQTTYYVYHWPDGRHEPVTRLKVKALIIDPAPAQQIVQGTYTVQGKAWAGMGPVRAVEVRIDDKEWQPADLQPAGEPFAWQSWTFTWQADLPGRHLLRARACDATGKWQPEAPAWNRLGYGNNAVATVPVQVRGGN
jgi:DMSO/TMAO reductase YedYZ molybdopterin-dependent catalytic subunit